MSYRIDILETDYGSCPVCGVAGGNCRGEARFNGSMIIEKKKQNDPNATFIVPRRIWTEEIVGSRKVRKLLHAKGDRITPEEAKQLGLMP